MTSRLPGLLARFVLLVLRSAEREGRKGEERGVERERVQPSISGFLPHQEKECPKPRLEERGRETDRQIDRQTVRNRDIERNKNRETETATHSNA